MFTIVPNHLIDRRRWDALVHRSSKGLIYSLSWYLDAVAPQKWSVLVNSDYTIGLPVVHAVKLGRRYAYQPVYAQRFNILFDGPKSEALVKTVVRKLISTFNFVDIQLDIHSNTVSKGIKTADRNTQELDLKVPYSILQQRYSCGLKYSLRKAKKHQLRLCTEINIHEFDDFAQRSPLYRNHNAYRSKHLHLMRLIAMGNQHARAAQWGVRLPNGELLCVAFFAVFKGRLYYLFECGTSESRKMCAVHFLTDAMIKHHAQHLHRLDFMGSDVPSIAYFNRQFGADNRCYMRMMAGSNAVTVLYGKLRRPRAESPFVHSVNKGSR